MFHLQNMVDAFHNDRICWNSLTTMSAMYRQHIRLLDDGKCGTFALDAFQEIRSIYFEEKLWVFKVKTNHQKCHWQAQRRKCLWLLGLLWCLASHQLYQALLVTWIFQGRNCTAWVQCPALFQVPVPFRLMTLLQMYITTEPLAFRHMLKLTHQVPIHKISIQGITNPILI